MAVTSRALANIHIFPTLALYNSNSSSLANTDIAFIRASGATDSNGTLIDFDLGNIIDQQLGINGYIKYSCGIVIQWMHIGPSESETDYKYFPIEFPNECFSILSSDCWKQRSEDNIKYAMLIHLVDKTKFTVRTHDGNANSGKPSYGDPNVHSVSIIAVGN